MPNINDYIKWRGDLSFEADPINEIDNLILSRISYLPFKEIKFKTAYFVDFDKDKSSVDSESEPVLGNGNEQGEEEMIATREDFKEKKEDLPPFNSPLTITSAESSTYIENEIDFQKKPKIKKVSSRLL